MKKLSILFAFIGFFAMTNVSAQSAGCCVLADGTCILCPAGSKSCDAKGVKTCNVAAQPACNTAPKACVAKSENTCTKATAVSNTNAAKKEGNTCCGLPVSGCSKAKEASKTAGKLAEKLDL